MSQFYRRSVSSSHCDFLQLEKASIPSLVSFGWVSQLYHILFVRLARQSTKLSALDIFKYRHQLRSGGESRKTFGGNGIVQIHLVGYSGQASLLVYLFTYRMHRREARPNQETGTLRIYVLQLQGNVLDCIDGCLRLSLQDNLWRHRVLWA